MPCCCASRYRCGRRANSFTFRSGCRRASLGALCRLRSVAALRERRDVFRREMAVSVGAKRTILAGGRPEELQGTSLARVLFCHGSRARCRPEAFAAGLGPRCPSDDCVVSSRLWRRLLGGRLEAIGQTLRLNDELCEVVGVMPPDWERVDDSDFWRAYRLAEDLANPNHFLANVVARVRPGLSLREVEAALKGSTQRRQQETEGPAIHLVPMRRYLVGDFWSPLLALIGAAGFVLLISCANVANLLRARAAGRRREIGVRKALGARWRISRCTRWPRRACWPLRERPLPYRWACGP